MKRLGIRPFILAAAHAASLSACTSTPSAEVTRFHLGGQIARGTVFLEPAEPQAAGSIEFRTYANRVAEGWRRLGFQPVSSRGMAEYVSVLSYGYGTRSAIRNSGSSVSVGVGGSSGGWHGGGFGVGGGVSIPLGGSKSENVALSSLGVTLRRSSDATAIWEGRASVEATSGQAEGNLSGAVPLLVDAVFSNFPGPSGKTTVYKPGS